MAVDWPSQWQYILCTKGYAPSYEASLGPVAVHLPETQPFYNSWVLHWVLKEPGN